MTNFGRESEVLEFKESTSEMDNALKTIVAMLNKHGKGTIYFGVKDDGFIKAKSIILGKDSLRDIGIKIEEHIKPLLRPTVCSIHFPEGDVIKVEVEGKKQPYCVDKLFYIRVADQNKTMSLEEISKLIINKYYFDWEKGLSNSTIDDVDEKSLKCFFQDAIEANRIEKSRYKKSELLKQLDLLCDDLLHLNNAGNLLFSNKGPIALNMATFATDNKTTFLNMKPLKGNIFTLIDSSLDYIKEHINWRADYQDSKRLDIPEIPISAIREIVVNGFAHANYVSNTKHEIDIYPSTIEIYSPGSFIDDLAPIDYINTKSLSRIRNNLICDVLFKSNRIENWGTGFQKVYSLCGTNNIDVSYRKEYEGFWFIFNRNVKYNPTSNYIDNCSPINLEKSKQY